jgi:thiamine biosynthesis lipoprotein
MIATRDLRDHRERFGGVARATDGRPLAAIDPIVPVSHVASSMGGRLLIHLDAAMAATAGSEEAVRASAAAVERVERWAARLTRHTDESDLSRLNADPRFEVPIRPTLAAALRAGRTAFEESEGLADVTLLDARLAAEGILRAEPVERRGFNVAAYNSRAFDWSLALGRRGAAVVRRPPSVRFDLGGVGKGWIADRALNLLAAWPSAVIDADGDLAIQCAPGKMWELAVDDPRSTDATLAVLRLTAPDGFPTRWGVATSGTSIHRWTVDGRPRHHLIDPRTGLPAVTDIVQATVIAGSALRAESLAKAAVIAGSVDGFALLERAGVRGAILLTERGEAFALPQTLPLLGS